MSGTTFGFSSLRLKATLTRSSIVSPMPKMHAAAGFQADLLRQAHRIDALLPGVRRDDLRVVFLRRLQVVVDAANARFLQVARLLFVEPAQRGAVADAVHLLHGVDRFHDLRPFAFGRAATAVDDAEGAGAVVAGAVAGRGDLGGVHHGVRRRRRCRSGPIAQNAQSSEQLPNFVGRMLQNVTRSPWK